MDENYRKEFSLTNRGLIYTTRAVEATDLLPQGQTTDVLLALDCEEKAAQTSEENLGRQVRIQLSVTPQWRDGRTIGLRGRRVLGRDRESSLFEGKGRELLPNTPKPLDINTGGYAITYDLKIAVGQVGL